MDLSQLIVLFYRFPLETITTGFVIVTLLLVWTSHMLRQHRWLRPTALCCLLIWAAVVLYITILSRDYKVIHAPQLALFHSYRSVLQGGPHELLRSNFMNMALFYPAGVLYGLLLSGKKHAIWQLFGGIMFFACFSAGIEYSQYAFQMGTPEIDDVLHNTLGALFGWLCFRGFLRDLELHSSLQNEK